MPYQRSGIHFGNLSGGVDLAVYMFASTKKMICYVCDLCKASRRAYAGIG